MKYYALLGVLLLAVACGSKNDHGPVAIGEAGGTFGTGVGGHGNHTGSGGGGTGGDTTMAEAGAAGDGGITAPRTPTVKITSPVAVNDPNAGSVVTTRPLTVLCDVIASPDAGATLDTHTVKIQATDGMGMAIETSATAPTQNPMDANEYGATVALVGIANGPISFTCSVADKSAPPKITTTTVHTYYDQGPTITVASPPPLSSYSLKNKILFKFSVIPAPLSASDKLAAVDMSAGKVTLTVDDQPIDLGAAQDPTDPTTYSVNVDLSNPLQFPKTPTGMVPVQITAWNQRGTEATRPYTFDIDGAPPVVQIVSPTTGQVVGGHVTLEFKVTDSQSGVDPASVNITLDNLPPIPFDGSANSGWAVSSDGKTFDYGFDSSSPDINSNVQLHVVIGAADKATNVATGATEDLYLDNYPPVVDLDPPALRERRFVSAGKYLCSAEFDPLGASPSDLDVVPDARIYRALVADRTNTVTGLTVAHYAGTDPSSAVLYAQADPAIPLLIAKHNTNGICDDLAVGGTAKPVPEVLVPIAPAGASYFPPSAPPILKTCDSGSDVNPPNRLCAANASDLTRVIDGAVVGSTVPLVYSLQSNNTLECTGQNWVLPDAGLPNGWICLAALAKDNVGNLGISSPLRVCLNSQKQAEPACANSSTVPPTCTDGCVPPGHFVPFVFDSSNTAVPHVLDLPH